MRLLREGILDAEAINRLEKEVDEEVRLAAERALRRAPAPLPKRFSASSYSEDLDPTSAELKRSRQPPPTPRTRTMADLINLLPERRVAARSAHRHLWRGRCRLQPRKTSARGR